MGEGAAFSGVDGDDLAAASADQEDPVETVSEDLEELHVLKRSVKEKRRSTDSIDSKTWWKRNVSKDRGREFI